MSASGAARIPPPMLATGVPHPLHQYADSLNPTFDHIAMMTENLHRLDSVEATIQDTLERNDDYVKAMSVKIGDDLRYVLQGLREEVSNHDARVRDATAAHEARVEKHLGDAATRILRDLDGIALHSRRNLENMLSTTKQHNSTLSQNVRAGQTAWSRLQAQLIMLNAWAVAWPEAVRNNQGGSAVVVAPPQYENNPSGRPTTTGQAIVTPQPGMPAGTGQRTTFSDSDSGGDTDEEIS